MKTDAPVMFIAGLFLTISMMPIRSLDFPVCFGLLSLLVLKTFRSLRGGSFARAALLLPLSLAVLKSGTDPAGFKYRDIFVESDAKKALVIGIQKYDYAPELHFSDADAQETAKSLRQAGFQTSLFLDLTQSEFEDRLAAFAKTIRSGDVVFFYYAGHGTSVSGENYLIPRDFEIKLRSQIKVRAIRLSSVLETLKDRNPQLLMLATDACRTVVFDDARAIGATDGLAPISAAGTLIAFAADTNERALEDSEIGHGIFTKFMLDALAVPGLSLHDIFKRVRFQTRAITSSQQNPYVYDGTDGDFIFYPMLPPAEKAVSSAVSGNEKTPELDSIIRRANAGDPTAMVRLAMIECEGQVLPNQVGSPTSLLQRASQSNNSAALAAYGIQLSTGRCVHPDDVAAVQVLTRAALANEPDAMYYLGVHFREGRGVPKNGALGLDWLKRSSTLGWPGALTEVGLAYLKGVDVNQSGGTACQYFVTAADLGDREGMSHLADAYRNGIGCSQSFAKALSWATKAAELGDLHAMESLIEFAQQGLGMAPSPKIAAFWSKRAAEGGSVFGLLNYGDALRTGSGVLRDCAEAAKHYMQASERG